MFLKKIPNVYLWIAIFLIGLGLRYWFSSSELCFYTDQSRDAIVANRILNGDLQLFGPVVNSQGAFFHGVLYYYVIAPIYAIAFGNPLTTSIILSLISTLSFIPTYFLSKKILKNEKLALISVAMLSVSLSHIETSASFWNLQLSIIILPLYGLYLLKTLEKSTIKNIFFSGLFLGLLIQSGFQNIQWILPIIVLFGLIFKNRKSKLSFLKITLFGLLGLGLSTSSMILVELLAWKRGLFEIENSLHWVNSSGFSLSNIVSIAPWYFESITKLLIPSYGIVTFLFIILSVPTLYFHRKNQKSLWLVLLLLPPIGGQIASNSVASYLLTGYESIFYPFVLLVVSTYYYQYKKTSSLKRASLLAAILFCVFFASNIFMLQRDMSTNQSLSCMGKTTSFEELQAIDYTYETAQGNPFTIDVITEPYGINLKYGYLYSWYGQKKYGYTPTFIGIPQLGYLSEGLLDENNTYSERHFIIYEPGTYNYWFHRRTKDSLVTEESQNIFYYRQPKLESLQSTTHFGENIDVDYYLSENL